MILKRFIKIRRAVVIKPIVIKTVILLMMILFACENPITSNGPQPSLIGDHQHNPMLNIFGVLRPDSLQGRPRSFVHLEASYSVLEEYPDSFIVADADVKIFQMGNGNPGDSVIFDYTNFQDITDEFEYRPADFFPVPGRTYAVTCYREGYPVLTSSTTMPHVPVLQEHSVNLSSNNLSFVIARDSLAGLYDCYFYMDEQIFYSRNMASAEGNSRIDIPVNRHSDSGGILIVYAYDKKLSEYLTATVIIKPNSYQPDVSTVENGYGSFGSLNMLETAILED